MSIDLATLAADPERIGNVAPDALPALIGEAESLRALLWARLQTAPAPAAPAPASNGTGPDRLLTADQAAELLGVDRRWMYRHKAKLPFTRKLSEGTLRFSSRGLEKWKDRR